MLEIVMQEDKLILECADKEYLQRTSVFWTSYLVDRNRVTTSKQFALPVLGCRMWTQKWPLMGIQEIDWEVRAIVIKNEGRHPCGSNAIVYTPREKRDRGLPSFGRDRI